jgi:T-complex protein 1 subunit gamma
MSAPVFVLNQKTKRESGRKTQLTNIKVAKAVADVIKTTLGPRSMLKMLLDPMGGIVLSNDGHAILREIEVNHPAAKSMLEISRAQDEEVGDGTTSVIILAGEMMVSAEPFITKETHPTIIVNAYYQAMNEGIKILKEIAVPIDFNNDNEVKKALLCCIGTKFAARWKDMVVDLALKSVRCILTGCSANKLSLDVKRYAKIEKIPGGNLD